MSALRNYQIGLDTTNGIFVDDDGKAISAKKLRLFLGDTIRFTLSCVEQDYGDGTFSTYSIPAGTTLTAGIKERFEQSATEPFLALTESWTITDGSAGAAYFEIDLSTSNLDDFLQDYEYREAWLEIELTATGGEILTTLAEPVDVRWSSIGDAPANPTVTPGYYTKTESDARYIQDSTGTTLGDLLVYDGSDFVRLPIGTDGKVLKANSSATNGVEWATESGGGGGASPYGAWKYATGGAAPSAKHFTTNNADAELVTSISISDENDDGVDMSQLLSLIGVGDLFYIQEESDSTKAHLYEVTAATDNTTYWTFTVTHEDPGSGGTWTNNQRCSIYRIAAASTGDVSAASNIADNAIVKGDGGAKGVQASGITCDDSNNVSGIGNITLTGTVDGRDVATDGSKLDGIATGATANQTDAYLLSRANHTGTQTASTISDFDTEVSNNTDVTANTAKLTANEANVTSALDGATITSATVATGDKVLIQDVDDSDNLKTVTAQSIADLASGGGALPAYFKDWEGSRFSANGGPLGTGSSPAPHAESGTNLNIYGAAFDDSQTETAGPFRLRVPDSVDNTVDVDFHIRGFGGDTNNAKFQIQYATNGDNSLTSADSTFAVSTSKTAIAENTISVDMTLTAGDELIFYLSRLGADAADTSTGDFVITLLTVEIGRA